MTYFQVDEHDAYVLRKLLAEAESVTGGVEGLIVVDMIERLDKDFPRIGELWQ